MSALPLVFLGLAAFSLVVLLVIGATTNLLNDHDPIGRVEPSAHVRPRGRARRPQTSADPDDGALLAITEHAPDDDRGDASLEPAPVDLDALTDEKAA